MENFLKIAVILTIIFFVIEVVGGIISGSLSLLGDAGHMLIDVFTLLLSLAAIRIARRPPTFTKTFGYHRIEILAAFLNGIILVLVSIWIFVEALERYYKPVYIQGYMMFIVAFIGLIVNIYVTYNLHGTHDVNIKSAYLHVLTDTLTSIGVIIAAVIILLTGLYVIDPILAFIISFFILYSAVKILYESGRILLEFAPKDIDINKLINDLKEVNGVLDIHDIHIWSLCSNINLLDAHIVISEDNVKEMNRIREDIKNRLKKYNIIHSTIEFEWKECAKPCEISEVTH